MMTDRSRQPAPDVRIQLPPWMRVVVGAFLTFWLGGVGFGIFLTFSRGGGAAAVMPVLMFCFGLFVGSSILRLEVRAAGDELRIRNNFGTRTIRRSEIEGFRMGQLNGPIDKVLFVMIQGGEIEPMHVTRQQPFGRRRREAQLIALQAWHSQRSTVA